MLSIAGTASNITAVIMLIIAAIVDIRTRRIPDLLIMSFSAAGLLYISIGAYQELPDGLLGALIAVFSMLLAYKVSGGGLGLGDVKLFGCTGLYLGLEDTLAAMLASVIFCGFFSLVLIGINRENRKRELPFAPFMLAGTLAALFL
ncbi:MAG TPA: A24 family peptidase [Negativicutes bacterium]|nr:A24 family peptidase [Negativicutes bacterium]